MTANDDDENFILVDSPLSTRINDENTYVDIEIYRGEDDKFWVLEVVDEIGGSTVWDDKFPTDQAALKEALNTIEEEGLDSFIQDEVERPKMH
jgi:uncharacterized protein